MHKTIDFPNLGIHLKNVGNHISIGGFDIAFYGIIIGLGILAGILIAAAEAKRTKQNSETYFDLTLYAVVFAIMASGMFLLTFLWTKERVQPIKEEKGSLKEDLKDLGRNKPWWILLCAGIMALVFNSLRDGSAVFYFKYYVDSSDTFSFSFMNSAITLITIYLVLGQAANILGIMFVPSLTKRIGKKKTYFVAMVGATILSVLFYFLPKDFI